MEIIDISVPIHSGMVTYPGDPQVLLERVESIPDGASANVSRLDLGVHTATVGADGAPARAILIKR